MSRTEIIAKLRARIEKEKETATLSEGYILAVGFDAAIDEVRKEVAKTSFVKIETYGHGDFRPVRFMEVSSFYSFLDSLMGEKK